MMEMVASRDCSCGMVSKAMGAEVWSMRRLRMVVFCLIVWVCVERADGAHRPAGEVRREDRKRAADGVTEGWVLTYDNPDPDRSWERIAGALVVARRGRVIRRWEIMTVRGWLFWDGGREVAVEWGGLHFATQCYLASVETGRKVASYRGNCGEAGRSAPAWVRALQSR